MDEHRQFRQWIYPLFLTFIPFGQDPKQILKGFKIIERSNFRINSITVEPLYKHCSINIRSP